MFYCPYAWYLLFYIFLCQRAFNFEMIRFYLFNLELLKRKLYLGAIHGIFQPFRWRSRNTKIRGKIYTAQVRLDIFSKCILANSKSATMQSRDLTQQEIAPTLKPPDKITVRIYDWTAFPINATEAYNRGLKHASAQR